MNSYKLKLNSINIVELSSEPQIIFLCGVKFSNNSLDKRVALKDILSTRGNLLPVILEEHFSSVAMYGKIGMRNLHDVESLVAHYSNATIVIHESISTAAEIGMLASSKKSAQKTLVLHPDEGSIEENKISGFLNLAYYSKAASILPRSGLISFYPSIVDKYSSNHRYIFHTSLPDKFTDSYTNDKIIDFLKQPNASTLNHIRFSKLNYKNKPSKYANTIDYTIRNTVLEAHISLDAIKPIIFSLLSIKELQKEINNARAYIHVVNLLDKWMRLILMQTLLPNTSTDITKVKIHIKGIDSAIFQNDTNTSEYRISLSMLVYLLKALGFLSVYKNKKFKITNNYKRFSKEFGKAIEHTKNTTFYNEGPFHDYDR